MSNNGQQQSTMMSNRDVQWSMVAVGTTVALVAFVTDYDGKLSDKSREHKWIASAISISFAFAWMAVFANMLMRTKFVGTAIEGATCILVSGFWAAVMPTLMAGGDEVSVTEPMGGISNPNLYFFAWFSLVMSFMTLVHFVNARFGTSGHCLFTSWGALTMTSIVVAVSAGRLHDEAMCSDEPWLVLGNTGFGVVEDYEKGCARTSFAISIGTIGGFLSVMWMLMDLFWSNGVKTTIELGLGSLMFILWIFGVGFITFGTSAPAQALGNLYFFTWGSFVSSLMVFLQAFGRYKDCLMTEDTEGTENNGAVADEKKSNVGDNAVVEGESSA